MQKYIIQNLLILVFTVVLTISLPLVATASTDTAIDATCRITAPDGSVGSGCVFEISQGSVYILTVAHVANAPTMTCEFWKAGHQSSKFPAQLISRNEQIDAAILAIPEAAFGGVLPKAIPVAPADCVLKPGDTIVSAGCANGSWETSWKGHVLGYQGSDLLFTPGPADGRSGSAILDADGRQIVAIIRARNTIDGRGIATSVQALRSGLAHNTQCGPNGCPVPATPSRIGIGLQIGRSASPPPAPWPTLPQPPQAQATPPVDLTPIANSLDRLNASIADMRPHQPTYTASDPTVLQAISQISNESQQHGQAIQSLSDSLNSQKQGLEKLRNEIPQYVDGAMKPLGDRLDRVESATKPIADVRDRLETIAESGGLRGRIAQRIEDRMDDPVGWIRHVLITLGAVMGIGIAIAIVHAIHANKQAIEDGQPSPLDQKLAQLQSRLESQGKDGLANVVGEILNKLKATETKIDSQVAAQTIANVQQAASQAVTAALATNPPTTTPTGTSP